MTHRSKKPFECKFEGCEKSYCDARSLRRHLENHHQHNPDSIASAPPPAQYPSDNPGNFSDGAAHIQFAPPQYSQNSQTATQGQYFQVGLAICIMEGIITEKLVIPDTENIKAKGRGVFCFTDDDVFRW